MLMNIENLVTCVIIERKLFLKVQKRYIKRPIKRSMLCLIVNGKFHSQIKIPQLWLKRCVVVIYAAPDINE